MQALRPLAPRRTSIGRDRVCKVDLRIVGHESIVYFFGSGGVNGTAGILGQVEPQGPTYSNDSLRTVESFYSRAEKARRVNRKHPSFMSSLGRLACAPLIQNRDKS